MLIERLEQIAAVVVTAGLVAGNFFSIYPLEKWARSTKSPGSTPDIATKTTHKC
jgi:hypothetical protein